MRIREGNRVGRERIDYIDIIKGIGILLMVIGHSYSEFIPYTLKILIYGFHMPLFFILSGYVYYKFMYGQYKSKEGFCRLMKKNYKAYLVPYFYLVGINLIISIIRNCKNLGGVC